MTDRRRRLLLLGLLGGAGVAQTWAEQIVAMDGDDLIALWPQNETEGTTSFDISGNGHNGTYAGVTLADDTFVDGSPAAVYPGVNCVNNVTSAGLGSTFDLDEFTWVLWFKVANAGVWTDGTTRRLLDFRRDGDNYTSSFKLGSTGSFNSDREGDDVRLFHGSDIIGELGWIQAALSVSVSGSFFRVYINGLLVNEKTSNVIASAGSGLATALIGAFNTAGSSQPWHGSIGPVVIYERVLSGTEVLERYEMA
jgi:hypothetical protein